MQSEDIRQKAINEKKIIIKGAREHNLKNIDVTIPRDQFIVITGLSGSGKSHLHPQQGCPQPAPAIVGLVPGGPD